MTGDDGQARELDGRIRFGPAAGNSIPADWAGPLLRRLHDAHPAAFGKQLMELYAEIRLGQALTVAKKRTRAG